MSGVAQRAGQVDIGAAAAVSRWEGTGRADYARGLSRDWGSCRDGCWRMRIVGGLEAPAGHIAPSAHPQSLNTPAIGSSRKPSFDAGPADLSRLQRSKSSPLHKLVHLSLRYNPCSVWFLVLQLSL